MWFKNSKAQVDGKIVLITGGASGIGKALALEMGRHGARIRLADHNLEQLERTVAELRSRSGGAEVVGTVVDVTDPIAVETWVRDHQKLDGRIDWLFNNAGIGITGEVRDMTLESWNRILDVNLRGVIHGVQAAYPIMIEQGHGHIANIACIAGLVPFPMNAAYCATKHAIVGLTNAMRGEAARLGVRVSVVCPGTIATEMFDHNEYLNIDKQALLKRLRPALVPAERCAREILSGVLANRAIITINLNARLVWWAYRLAPTPLLSLMAMSFGKVSQSLRLPRSPQERTPINSGNNGNNGNSGNSESTP